MAAYEDEEDAPTRSGHTPHPRVDALGHPVATHRTTDVLGWAVSSVQGNGPDDRYDEFDGGGGNSDFLG